MLFTRIDFHVNAMMHFALKVFPKIALGVVDSANLIPGKHQATHVKLVARDHRAAEIDNYQGPLKGRSLGRTSLPEESTKRDSPGFKVLTAAKTWSGTG